MTTYVQLTFIQAAKIDAVEQAFYCDFYLTLIWRDDSQANVTNFDPTATFAPVPEFTNQILSDAHTVGWSYIWGWYGVPQSLIPPVGNVGTWISAYSRVSGTFLTTIDMRDFPLDLQSVIVKIEHAVWDYTYITYVPLPGSNSLLLPPNLDIVGWTIDTAGGSSLQNYYASFNQTYSQCRFEIHVSRIASYYVNRLISNVALLVCIAFSAVTLDPTQPERNLLVLASFGSVVAWEFIVINLTPQAGYLTRADVFMNLSFGIIFALCLGHALNHFLSGQALAETKKVKRESMVKLHKALERLAARGDPAAQAMLSARVTAGAAHSKYSAPGSRATPKGAGFLPARHVRRGSNASAEPPRRQDSRSLDGPGTHASAQWQHHSPSRGDMTVVAVHPTARTASSNGIAFGRAPSGDAMNPLASPAAAHVGVPPPHPFAAASHLLSSRDDVPASPEGATASVPASPLVQDNSVLTKHGSVTKLLIPVDDDHDEHVGVQAEEQARDTAAATAAIIQAAAAFAQPVQAAAEFKDDDEAAVSVSVSRPWYARVCAPLTFGVHLLISKWSKLTLFRKIDILITATCAAAYVVGILVIFFRPPNQPVFDAH